MDWFQEVIRPSASMVKTPSAMESMIRLINLTFHNSCVFSFMIDTIVLFALRTVTLRYLYFYGIGLLLSTNYKHAVYNSLIWNEKFTKKYVSPTLALNLLIHEK